MTSTQLVPPARSLAFRNNVAALILVGEENPPRVLACERAEGGGWQSVQGGVEPNDSDLEAAIVREIGEEIGVAPSDVTIEGRSRYWRRYRFPPEVVARWKRPTHGHAGQEQMWFLARIASTEVADLSRSQGEFCSLRTLSPRELVDAYVLWKRACVLDFCMEMGLLV
jgi:8-oxo-dGTP pyrophosphatase MutT (NUDIX family)